MYIIFAPFEKNAEDKNHLETLLNITKNPKFPTFISLCDSLSQKLADFKIKTIFLYKNSQLVEAINQICLQTIDQSKKASKLNPTILLEVLMCFSLLLV